MLVDSNRGGGNWLVHRPSRIDVPNAQPNGQGVASVNPIFTWVRLAQRIPVRIELEAVPEGVVLVAGMTATVEVQPGSEAARLR